MKILGIDPGLRRTGFGIINVNFDKPQYVTSGIIATLSSDSLAERLKSILNGIQEIIRINQPDVVSMEKIFVNNNPKSTLLLGQARGVAIAGCLMHDLEIFEYTALQIKKSVVGYGRAEKEQIGQMITYLLNLNGTPSSDASDALAIAITHLNSYKFHKIINTI